MIVDGQIRVRTLLDSQKGKPILVIGNGPSRKDKKIPFDKFLTIGCNGLAFDETYPDYLMFNTYGFARSTYNELKRIGGLDKTKIAIPEQGDNKFSGSLPNSIAFRRSFKSPNWQIGLFSAGMLGNACVELALLLGGDPIILAGFDGDAQHLYQGKPFYRHGPAEAWFIADCHRKMIDVLRKSGRSVFQLYPHKNLPFPVFSSERQEPPVPQ